MWWFGQVWLLCLLAFVIGAVLSVMLFVRPLRKQVRQLEIQLSKAKRAEAGPPPKPVGNDVEQGWGLDRLPSWEREHAQEPGPHEQHQPDLGYAQPESLVEPEPAPEPAVKDVPSQIPNPSPAEMELVDHGPAESHQGQLAHAPAEDWENDRYLVDDVADEELTEQEREAAAEITGPVAASVIEAAEQSVQERLAGQIGGGLAPEPEPAPTRQHRYLEEEDDTSLLPAAVEPAEPQPEPEPEPQRRPEPLAQALGAEGEVRLEALAEPIPIRPDQFGKPIPPGALTPPPTPEAATPPAARQPPVQQPKLPEPAPMAAVERPRSLFEPVLDPEDDAYEELHGFPPLQQPTRTLTSTDSAPFTPMLAPGLLESEKPVAPVSTPAGLPKRTASGAWPRGGDGLSARPVPFAESAPLRPRAPFNPIPRIADKAPIRRPVSGGPRTPFGPGSALPRPDGSAPSDEYLVKAQLASRRYHTASSSAFDSATAEVWFRSAEEAERAGFSPAE